MRLTQIKTHGQPVGYTLELSKRETFNWARRADNCWPVSTLADCHIWLECDRNGLCDFTIDGKRSIRDAHELAAIVSDHLPADCAHLWPN